MATTVLRDVLEATGYLAGGEPAHGVLLGDEARLGCRTRQFTPDARWLSDSAVTVHFKYEPRVVFPDGGTWATVYDCVSRLPRPAWRSPGGATRRARGDTASPSPRFAGDSPGDGATSSARTEVWWTNGRWYDNSPVVSRCCRRKGAGRDRAGYRMPCPDAAGGRAPAVTARDRMPAALSGDPDCTGVEAALRRAAARARRQAAAAGGEVMVFRGGEVVREKPVREPGSAPGAATRQAGDTSEERPEDTRPRGGHRDGGGVR